MLLQSLTHGFFNFETFDVDEYEHYEVRFSLSQSIDVVRLACRYSDTSHQLPMTLPKLSAKTVCAATAIRVFWQQ